MPVTLWKALCFASLLVIPAGSCLADDSQETLTRRLIWEAATRSPEPSMPSPISQFTDLLYKRGIKRESVKTVLVEYAEGRNLPKECGSEVAAFSVQVLVGWRCRDILPMLIERATANIDTKDDMARNARNGALSMVMRIGGGEALQVADKVASDPQKYGTLARYYVYENLASHLTITNMPEADRSFCADLFTFLDAQVQKETDPACVEVMDKALAAKLEEYRRSKRREDILKKFGNTQLPYQREYIQETLDKLRIQKQTTKAP